MVIAIDGLALGILAIARVAGDQNVADAVNGGKSDPLKPHHRPRSTEGWLNLRLETAQEDRRRSVPCGNSIRRLDAAKEAEQKLLVGRSFSITKTS
jgi:hypothetical protein